MSQPLSHYITETLTDVVMNPLLTKFLKESRVTPKAYAQIAGCVSKFLADNPTPTDNLNRALWTDGGLSVLLYGHLLDFKGLPVGLQQMMIDTVPEISYEVTHSQTQQ